MGQLPDQKAKSAAVPHSDLFVQDCRLLSTMLGKLEEYCAGTSSPSSPPMVEVMVENTKIRLEAFEILYRRRRDFQPDREQLNRLGETLGERYGFPYRRF